jgi:hypothetical protein
MRDPCYFSFEFCVLKISIMALSYALKMLLGSCKKEGGLCRPELGSNATVLFLLSMCGWRVLVCVSVCCYVFCALVICSFVFCSSSFSHVPNMYAQLGCDPLDSSYFILNHLNMTTLRIIVFENG